MHDKVNDLCLERCKCATGVSKGTWRNGGVSRVVARLTVGVSISVTRVSPAAALGDHCSAEMSPSVCKWLRTVPHSFPETPHTHFPSHFLFHVFCFFVFCFVLFFEIHICTGTDVHFYTRAAAVMEDLGCEPWRQQCKFVYLGTWTSDIMCDIQVLIPGQHVSPLSLLCKHAFLEDFFLFLDTYAVFLQ